MSRLVRLIASVAHVTDKAHTIVLCNRRLAHHFGTLLVWLCLVLDSLLTICDPLLQWGSCVIVTGCSGVSAHRGLDLRFLLALLRCCVVAICDCDECSLGESRWKTFKAFASSTTSSPALVECI